MSLIEHRKSFTFKKPYKNKESKSKTNFNRTKSVGKLDQYNKNNTLNRAKSYGTMRATKVEYKLRYKIRKKN